MSKKRTIPYMRDMRQQKIRLRDGAVLTHQLTISLTTEEAIYLSDMFAQQRAKNEPGLSLFRAAILELANAGNPTEYVNNAVAKMKVKTALADKLAEADYLLALTLLYHHKAQQNAPKPAKQKTPPKPEPSAAKATPMVKERREYVPPPPRYKR